MYKPGLYSADELRNWAMSKEISGNRWVACRPIVLDDIPSWFMRLALAWGVLTGRYDALFWVGQEKPNG